MLFNGVFPRRLQLSDRESSISECLGVCGAFLCWALKVSQVANSLVMLPINVFSEMNLATTALPGKTTTTTTKQNDGNSSIF